MKGFLIGLGAALALLALLAWVALTLLQPRM